MALMNDYIEDPPCGSIKPMEVRQSIYKLIKAVSNEDRDSANFITMYLENIIGIDRVKEVCFLIRDMHIIQKIVLCKVKPNDEILTFVDE